MRRAGPTRAATTTRTRASTRSTGSSVSGSTSARYSGCDAGVRHGAAAGGGDALGVGARRLRSRPRGVEPGAQRQRADALLGAEADVAGGQREPVGLAHRGHDLEAHRDVEVAHHPPEDGDLLGVLLAEVGDVGRDDVEQLADDGADAVEVPGAALGALEDGARPADADARGEAVGVDLLDRAGRTGRRRRALGRRRRRAPRCAGRRRGRVASSNWAGLTNSETTTSSQASRAARISASWPAWNAPIVGTSPTRAAGRAGGGHVGADLGDRPERPHAAPPRRASRVAAASASNSGSRSGARSATAARWRATVASSPRAIGPVSASLGAQPRPVLDRGAHQRREQRAVDARGGGEPLRRALERDEEVRGDRGRRVVGGAVVVGDRAWRACRAARPARAPRRAPAAWSRRRRRPRRRTPARRAARDGHQRVQRERLVAGERRRARSRPSSGRRAGRARRRPPRRRSRRPGTHSSTASAPSGRAPRPSGPSTWRPAARRAAARAVPRRPRRRSRGVEWSGSGPVLAWEIPAGSP